MNVAAIGDATLKGWQRRVVDRVADPVSRKTPLSADQFRALIGVALLLLSLYTVLRRIRVVAVAARSATA